MAIIDTSQPSGKMPHKTLLSAKRRACLLWAALITVSFVTAQFYQQPSIVWLWLLCGLAGTGYMIKLRLSSYLISLVIASLAVGGSMSALSFELAGLAWLKLYLGVFWLFMMSLTHLAASLLDRPKQVYYVSTAMLALAGALSLLLESLLIIQFLVAGLVGALVLLWLFFNL